MKRTTSGGALCIALLLSHSPSARAEEDVVPAQAGQASPVGDFPKKLAIAVVANESVIATFEQRVSSWFTDGTEVRVRVAREVDQQRLLASSPAEVSAWIVPLSAERAIVIFSSRTARAPARYLVREVRLRNGLDDLGLERLASVIHSAFAALREGAEGVERAHAERELGEAGLAPAPSSLENERDASPTRLRAPAAPKKEAAASSTDRAPTPVAKPPSWLIFAVGYGGRLRGAEGLGHGPSLAAGLRLPNQRTPIDLLVSGQFLLPSAFDAELFSASVQTTALRFQAGIEPALGSSFWGQALVGVGTDIAQIHSSTAQSSTDGAVRAGARAFGTQWRTTGELTFGVLRHTEQYDLGLYAQITFLFEDVHYIATTDSGDHRLVTPWPVQPGLSFQGRFRSAL